MKRLLIPAAASLALIAGLAGANAADTPATQTGKVPSYAAPVVDDANAMKGADAMRSGSLRQQMQAQLEKAGYTDVKITPSSFFIQAKNKKGEPVAMVVGPDSFAEVTEITQKPGATAQAPAGQNDAMKPNATTKQ